MAAAKQKSGRVGGSFGRRLRGMPVEGTTGPTRRWPIRLGVLAIVVVAFLARFTGLSHDLNEGLISHPDTPKQIRMAERFLRGHYYFRAEKGNHDVDGYPCFNMHLVEYEWRGVSGVYSVFESLMGWRRQFTLPHEYPNLPMKLFVATRISVCVMSVLAVLVIFRIGLELWGPLVGLVGAGLAAVSPLSVESAHYAMSDSVMDLFACLTVLAALRMYRSERLIYPLLAGFLSALTFAAKYNGGIILVFVLLVCMLKRGSLKRMFSGGAFRDVGLILAGALVGVVAAIPSLLIYPDRVVKGIVLFSRLASRFRELPPVVASGERSLFWYAASANISLMVRVTGIVVLIGAVAGGVISAFRNRRRLLPWLFIGMYLVVVWLTARFVKPYYFSVLTLLFCLYVGVAVDWLTSLRRKLRAPGIVMGIVLAGVVLITSCIRVWRSDFFFWHHSSRRVATAWVSENIPEQFRINDGGYALQGLDRSGEDTVETPIMTTSTLRHVPVPPGSLPLQVFKPERAESLTWFRNPGVFVWLLPGSAHLRRDFSMPCTQRVPSATGNEYVVPEGAEFVRSGRMMALEPRNTGRIFIIDEAPEEVVIGLRNGDVGNVVTLSFGGRHETISLVPLETKVITIRDARRIRVIGRPLYAFRARAPFPCQAEVAVTREQKGVLYFNAAMYDEALPHLVGAWGERYDPTAASDAVAAHNRQDETGRNSEETWTHHAAAWRTRPSIALAQMAVIAAACSGHDLGTVDGAKGLAESVRADLDAPRESLFERFGISSLYVEHLPYIELEAEELLASKYQRTRYSRHDPSASADTCVVPGPADDGPWRIHMSGLFLEPGAYRVTLTARVEGVGAPGQSVRMSFIDTTGQIVYAAESLEAVELAAPTYHDVSCTLRLGERHGPVTLEISADPNLPLRIDRLVLRPDFEATVAARDRLVRALLDGSVADLEPVPEHFEPLMAYAGEAFGRDDVTLALATCEKASEADPGSYRPYDLLWRIRTRVPDAQRPALLDRLDEIRSAHRQPDEKDVSVRFRNGAALTGYRISSEAYAAGETIELTLHWDGLASETRRFAGRLLFIHFIPDGAPRDQEAFQADPEFVYDLGFDERSDRIRPVYRHRIRIPKDVEPGVYDIEIGIEILMHRKRIRVVEASVPCTNNSATIGSIRIVERAPVPSL